MLRTIFINLLLIVCFIATIELIGRIYYILTTEDGTFFREDLFVSPWFTTLNAPPPRLSVSGHDLEGLFNHAELTTSAKKDNVVRIVAIGGSTTKNARAWRSAGIDCASELTSRLERLFPDKLIEILNAGGQGYSSAHSLVNYALRISAFKPDFVIVMHNINDRSVAYWGKEVLPDYANKYMHPTYLAPEAQRFSSLYGTLVQSRVASRLGLAKNTAARDLNFNGDIVSAEQYFRRNMRYFAALAQSDGVDVLMLTQPFDPERMEPKQVKHQIAFNIAVKEIAFSSGSTFFDMQNALGTDPENFVDPIHYSEKGIVAFAEALTPVVASIITEKRHAVERTLGKL